MVTSIGRTRSEIPRSSTSSPPSGCDPEALMDVLGRSAFDSTASASAGAFDGFPVCEPVAATRRCLPPGLQRHPPRPTRQDTTHLIQHNPLGSTTQHVSINGVANAVATKILPRKRRNPLFFKPEVRRDRKQS